MPWFHLVNAHFLYTAVSTKVVKKSVRDEAERWSGKYPINFNKSSESIMPRPYSEDLRGLEVASNMESELLLKFIGYLPDYVSALSRTLLRFFGQPL